MIKLNEVEKLNKKDIGLKVAELKKQLLAFKLDSSVSRPSKPHVKKNLKKDIARLLTFGSLLKK